MGINNGKFFDAKATSTYFSDIETEFNSFKTSAISHLQSQNTLATTPYWQGYDAELAKKMLGEKDATLLQDILDLQTSMVQLQNDILEKFRWDVDSDYDARIEYDTLRTVVPDTRKLILAHQSVLRAGVTMMLRMGAVTATYMIIAITGIRAAPRTAEALKVPVVPQPLRVAILLRAQRVEARLQTARKLIHPAVVLQRRIRVLWILMMMATMRFMRMMITTGIVTGAMMIMLPVWMTPWKMRIGKSGRETHG